MDSHRSSSRLNLPPPPQYLQIVVDICNEWANINTSIMKPYEV